VLRIIRYFARGYCGEGISTLAGGDAIKFSVRSRYLSKLRKSYFQNVGLKTIAAADTGRSVSGGSGEGW